MLDDDKVELWLEDIIDVMKTVKKHSSEANSAAILLSSLNNALLEKDKKTLIQILR